MSAAPGPAHFRILYVCTGNLCRSPYAELLTRHLLERRLGGRAAQFDVSSAGVAAAVGSPIHADTRDQLPWALRGAATERFAARQLDQTMIEQADLVLGLAREHRSLTVAAVPRAQTKAFSLLEFVRLGQVVDVTGLPAAPVERARALVRDARMMRSRSLLRRPEDDDVPDPIGQPKRAHRHAAARIAPAARTLVDLIAPGEGG